MQVHGVVLIQPRKAEIVQKEATIEVYRSRLCAPGSPKVAGRGSRHPQTRQGMLTCDDPAQPGRRIFQEVGHACPSKGSYEKARPLEQCTCTRRHVLSRLKVIPIMIEHSCTR